MQLEGDPADERDDGEREEAEDGGRASSPAAALRQREQEDARTTERSTAPGTSIREVERTGDSGTKRRTRRSATATPIAPTTKIQRQLRWSTMRPESTSPSPPPTPKTAERSPIPTFIFSGGNSSRMMPKLRGNTAPAAPETMRKAISVQMSGAAAQPMHPRRKRPSATTSSRSFPKRSPSLPRIGVDRRREQEARHHPRHPAGRGAELALELGQGGHDHRLLEAYAVAASVSTPSVML